MEKGGIIKHDITKSPKTGNWAYARPEVNKDICIGCETCVQYCPDACIEMIQYNKQHATDKIQQKKAADVDYEFCKGCGVCAQVCPVKAISMRK